jgi:hypothetical protein
MTEDFTFALKYGSVSLRLSGAGTFISVRGRTILISGDGVTFVAKEPGDDVQPKPLSQPGDRPCA